MKSNMETILTTAIEEALNMGSIIPIDTVRKTFCIVPSEAHALMVPLYGMKNEEGIFLTEEDITEEKVMEAIFAEEDFKLGKFFKQEDIEEICDVDPILLTDLYVLMDEVTCNEEKLMSIIKTLIKDGEYHPEEVILNLLKMSKVDMEDFVKEEDIITAYQKMRF